MTRSWVYYMNIYWFARILYYHFLIIFCYSWSFEWTRLCGGGVPRGSPYTWQM